MKPAGKGEGMEPTLEAQLKAACLAEYCRMPIPSAVRIAKKFRLDKETVQTWAKNGDWADKRNDAQIGIVEEELTAAGVKSPNELIHCIWKGTRKILKEVEMQRKVEGANMDTLLKAITLYERADRIETSLRSKLGLKARIR